MDNNKIWELSTKFVESAQLGDDAQTKNTIQAVYLIGMSDMFKVIDQILESPLHIRAEMIREVRKNIDQIDKRLKRDDKDKD